jgi:deoxyribonuclease IV
LKERMYLYRLSGCMKIGFHLSIGKGFAETLRQAHRLGCEAVQVFVKNPRAWKGKEWGEEEREACRRLGKECKLFAHLSYLPNLARIDGDRRNLDGFLAEAEICGQLGINSLVVHLGSRPEREKGCALTAEAINRVLSEYPLTILMENSSGQGNGLGRDIAELGVIYDRVVLKERVALCLDTAHLHQAGYDLSEGFAWEGLVDGVERTFGPGKIGLFHLNDSKTGVGSRVDRHWHIGRGSIGLEAFRTLLNDKRFAHLCGVMETPKMGMMDEENMKTMRSLLPSLVPCPAS